MKIVMRIAVAAAVLVLLAQGARYTLGERRNEGMLRLSWRTLGQRVQICRDYTKEELKTLRQHMQRGQKCSIFLLPYRLEVQLDEATPVVRNVVPAGTRGDRPLYVKEDFLLPPGEHRVRISFVPEEILREDAANQTKNPNRVVEQQAIAAAMVKAPRFVLERTVRFTAGRIILVDIDPDRDSLRLFGEKPSTE